MAVSGHLPHIELLLRAMRISRDRLMSTSKIAVDAPLLRALIRAAAAAQPFDPAFYRDTYPDLADAHAAGVIPDLHRHYVESGVFEGRLAAAPPMDESFYAATYADVADGLRDGSVASAREHYIRAGAAEGRIPSAILREAIDAWSAVLGTTRPA